MSRTSVADRFNEALERVALGREFPCTRSFPCATRKGSHENVRTSINLHEQENESPGTNRYANSRFHVVPWTEQKVALLSSSLRRSAVHNTCTHPRGHSATPLSPIRSEQIDSYRLYLQSLRRRIGNGWNSETIS